MNNRIGNAAKYYALLLISFIFATCSMQAQTTSHARDVVIESPAVLPAESREPASDFYLNTNSGDGKAYLYIEQLGGKKLVVLDVTDLAHIKSMPAITLSLSEPFRFSEELNDSHVVLRSMDQKELAILNTQKAKAPILENADAFQHTTEVHPIGQETFLLASARPLPTASPAPQQYRVIEITKKSGVSTLYNVKGVIASIRREETGTLFLLGSEGLTVIRNPEREHEYEIQNSYTN